MKACLTPLILLTALAAVFLGSFCRAGEIAAKNVPCGPLFELAEKDGDPAQSIIRCYRNVRRLTDDRRYRLFDHRLQRWGIESVKNDRFAAYDDYKLPRDPALHLQKQQIERLRSKQDFLYYGYDSQIYLVEDKPEVFLEPAPWEHFEEVTEFSLENKVVYVAWSEKVAHTITCLDANTRNVVWQAQDDRRVTSESSPTWYGQLHWIDTRYLATLAQGRLRSLISIYDTKSQDFIKGEGIATWYRIVGHRVLQIDTDDTTEKRHVAVYFDPAHPGGVSNP